MARLVHRLNGGLGGPLKYRDAVYDGCTGDIFCTVLFWTHISPTRRIDFLFAGKGKGTTSVTDVRSPTFDEGDDADTLVAGSDREDLDYSEHRAVAAKIHY